MINFPCPPGWAWNGSGWINLSTMVQPSVPVVPTTPAPSPAMSYSQAADAGPSTTTTMVQHESSNDLRWSKSTNLNEEGSKGKKPLYWKDTNSHRQLRLVRFREPVGIVRTKQALKPGDKCCDLCMGGGYLIPAIGGPNMIICVNCKGYGYRSMVKPWDIIIKVNVRARQPGKKRQLAMCSRCSKVVYADRPAQVESFPGDEEEEIPHVRLVEDVDEENSLSFEKVEKKFKKADKKSEDKK